MRIYVTDEGDQLFDRNILQQIVGVSKSKIHRELLKITDRVEVKYKNQFLYDEQTAFRLMERVLFEKLDKMERKGYEF
jgi:hypothetical protein